MVQVRKTILILLIGAGLLLWAGPAAAAGDGACSPARARELAREATRAAARAERRAETARYVARQTVAFSERYGVAVGRWVRLALVCGWPRSQLGQLLYTVNRESRGDPSAKSSISTASGLLQFLAFHWDGTGSYGWRFDPFDARQNLKHGYLLWIKCGWSPWAGY